MRFASVHIAVDVVSCSYGHWLVSFNQNIPRFEFVVFLFSSTNKVPEDEPDSKRRKVNECVFIEDDQTVHNINKLVVEEESYNYIAVESDELATQCLFWTAQHSSRILSVFFFFFFSWCLHFRIGILFHCNNTKDGYNSLYTTHCTHITQIHTHSHSHVHIQIHYREETK